MRRGLIDAARDLLKRLRTQQSATPVHGSGRGVTVEYAPSIDGDADPGEVVWTWVAYEDDPSQGKDRPVLVIGHRGAHLAAVALTSKQHDNEPQVAVGTGPWDRQGRPSYAKIDRLLEVDPKRVRREGAILPEARFDAVVAGARRLHGSAFD
jgi:acetyl esterase/lipase